MDHTYSKRALRRRSERKVASKRAQKSTKSLPDLRTNDSTSVELGLTKQEGVDDYDGEEHIADEENGRHIHDDHRKDYHK